MKLIIRISYLVLSIAILLGCKELKEEIISEKYPDGSIKKQQTFVLHGNKKELIKQVLYYPNGQKKQEGQYINGLKQGEWTHWYETGQKWSEGNFKKDLSDGKISVYHENGNLKYQGSYKLGKPHGEWSFYNLDEEKVQIVIYDMDEIIKQENIQVPLK